MSKWKAPGEGSYRFLYGKYKYAAKTFNRPFEIDFSLFKELVTQDCFYCGKAPKDFNCYSRNNTIKTETVERNWIKANGIDRIDNSIGYVKDNCIPCCSVCNSMKLNYGLKHFIHHVFAIARTAVKRKFTFEPYF